MLNRILSTFSSSKFLETRVLDLNILHVDRLGKFSYINQHINSLGEKPKAFTEVVFVFPVSLSFVMEMQEICSSNTD